MGLGSNRNILLPSLKKIMENNQIPGGATLWARQTIESDIFLDKPDKWFKIWFYLVNRVSHKNCKKFNRGESFYQQEWICQLVKATPDQVKKCLSWLVKNNMISTRRSTRGTWIKVNNYERFQTLDNYYYDVKSPDEAPSTEQAPHQARNNQDENSEHKQKKYTSKKTEALKKHERSTKEARRYNKNDKNDKNINNNSLQAEPAEVLSEEDLAKQELTRQVEKVIDAFYQTVNPDISFGNKTTRGACEYLIKKYTFEKTMNAVKFAIEVQGQQYAPTITTPYELKQKMGALRVYYQKANSAPQKGKTILGL